MLSAFAARGDAAIVYRETFANSTLQNVALSSYGYSAASGNSGSAITTSSGAVSSGTGDGAPGADAPVNSGTTSTASTGNTFLNPTGDVRILLLTDEIGALNISSTDLISLSFASNNTRRFGNAAGVAEARPVYQIGGVYYATNDLAVNSAGSGFETFTFSADGEGSSATGAITDSTTAGYTVLDYTPGTTLALSGTTVAALPAGTIQSVGLFGFKRDTVRFDTITVDAVPVPEPTGLVTGAVAAAGGLAVRRRRRS